MSALYPAVFASNVFLAAQMQSKFRLHINPINFFRLVLGADSLTDSRNTKITPFLYSTILSG